jgi:energy-coupling factor transporter ATP-binding protein EcfA2
MQAQLKAIVTIEYFDRATRALKRRIVYKQCLLTYEHQRNNIFIEGEAVALNFPAAIDMVKLRTARAANGQITIQAKDMTLLISGADPANCQQFCYCLEHKCGVSVKTCVRSASASFSAGIKQVGPTAFSAPTTAARLSSGKAGPAASGADSMPSMTAEQHRVVTLIKGGRNVFFTGSAGSGKSLVLRLLKRMLPSSSTFFTASTAAAAVNVEGTTIHSWAGLTAAQVAAYIAGEINVEALAASIRARKDVFRRWKATKTLFVDEISMVDAPTFDLLDALARALLVPGMPFGGIQIVVSGDFFQLRPVGKPGQEVQYAFQSNAWKTAITYCVQLTTVFRQKDAAFITMLNEIRWGR